MSATFKADPEARKDLDEYQIDEFLEAFRVFDEDHGGTIDDEEFKKLMKMLGMDLTDKELDEIMTVMDADGDGELEFEEFLVLMATLMKRNPNDEFNEAFLKLSNGTGRLPTENLAAFLMQSREKVTDKEIEALIAIADPEGLGSVSAERALELISVSDVRL